VDDFGPTLSRARTVLRLFDSLPVVHRQGQAWVEQRYLPCIRKLEQAPRAADRRLAARGWAVLGEVHDLNGAPRAAVRAYQRSVRLDPRRAATWRAVGCLLDHMGEFQRARHALMRAVSLDRDDELAAGDLERVEWALLHGCPVLYDHKSLSWRASEALAAGRYRRALALLARPRTVRARQVRARIHSARGDVEQVLCEWTAVTSMNGRVQLAHADWYYTLRGAAADDARFWRLMLWQVRPKLEGGCFHYSPSLEDLELADTKRFELFARFELARCEGDVRSLLALAGRYPSWREPGEVALQLG
jgi:tetratricopeptide (TPR) repeat protein